MKTINELKLNDKRKIKTNICNLGLLNKNMYKFNVVITFLCIATVENTTYFVGLPLAQVSLPLLGSLLSIQRLGTCSHVQHFPWLKEFKNSKYFIASNIQNK